MFIVKHLEKIYEPNTRMQALVTSWHDNEYLLRRVLDVVYLWRRGDFKFLEIKLRTRHLPGLGASTAHGHCRFSAPFNPHLTYFYLFYVLVLCCWFSLWPIIFLNGGNQFINQYGFKNNSVIHLLSCRPLALRCHLYLRLHAEDVHCLRNRMLKRS